MLSEKVLHCHKSEIWSLKMVLNMHIVKFISLHLVCHKMSSPPPPIHILIWKEEEIQSFFVLHTLFFFKFIIIQKMNYWYTFLVYYKIEYTSYNRIIRFFRAFYFATYYTCARDLSHLGINRLGDFLSQINIPRQPLSPLHEIPSLQLLC